MLEVLLSSPNDAWRDDAAMQLTESSDPHEAENALVFAINSGRLDSSLRQTCAESLGTIWARAGMVTPTLRDLIQEPELTTALAYFAALTRR